MHLLSMLLFFFRKNELQNNIPCILYELYNFIVSFIIYGFICYLKWNGLYGFIVCIFIVQPQFLMLCMIFITFLVKFYKCQKIQHDFIKPSPILFKKLRYFTQMLDLTFIRMAYLMKTFCIASLIWMEHPFFIRFLNSTLNLKLNLYKVYYA